MIKIDSGPGLHVVALGALCTFAPAVHIVNGVTTVTAARRRLKIVTAVAVQASDTRMFASELKTKLLVIEIDIAKATRGVTGLTLGPQATIMDIFTTVTVNAGGRRFQIALARCVTIAALRIHVSACQREVAAIVIKKAARESYDVVLASLVIRMTINTFVLRGRSEAAVEAARCGSIGCNVFMTI